MNKLVLSLENAWQDFKSSDGRISFATQATLLFFLITLTLSSGAIQRYLAGNLDQMLGSDMVVEARSPLADEHEAFLAQNSDGVSKTTLTNITLTHGEEWARVQLKQVDNAYPLQGTLRIGETPVFAEKSVSNGPTPGSIWLGSRLAVELKASVGDTIVVSENRLLVTSILFHEPDRIMEGHSVALRAMVHEASIDAEQIENSSQRTRYLIEIDKERVANIEEWASSNLPGAQLLKKHGGQHPLAGFWKRTENFLGLASVILFFMGAVALDMTNRRWLAKMRFRLAIYSSFGTHPQTGMLMAIGSWLAGFVIAAIAGVVLASVAFVLIIAELQTYFHGLQGSWDYAAVLKTMGLVLLMMLSLKVPSFIQLSRASLLSLIRSTAEGTYVWHRLVFGLLSVSFLAAIYSDNWLLTAMTLSALAFALVLMMFLTWVVIRVGDMWGRRRTGQLPFAFFMMRQRLFAKSAQVMGLGLCGLLLLFTLMLMRDLGSMIERHNRSNDGNLVVSEAQENQMGAIRDWANNTGSSIRTMRPFVSAQLVQVNGQSLTDYIQKPSDTLATLKDPIRLSWSNEIPSNNRVVGGTWWDAGTGDWQQISTEPEVMTDMGFEYGDRLTYQIGTELYDFTLVASHGFKPGGSSVTFWFQVPETAKQHIKAPVRFMGTMELPETAWDELALLWQDHPTLSLAPLKELTDRFDQTVGMVTKITVGYAIMVLLLALFVLAASVSGFQADDRQKNGLLMSMGLKKADCLRLNFYDWGVTALIAAGGAIAGTWFAGMLIYQEQFGLVYNPDIVWVTGTIATMVTAICLVGYAACKRTLNVSVRDLLTA